MPTLPLPLPLQSATALARQIRSGALGARELLELYLDRVDRLNPALNAVIWQDRARARARADAADAARARGERCGPLVQNLLPAALLAGPAAWGWQPLAWADLPTVALIGALATAGLLALTWAFTHLEASRAAPMEYTGLVWATGLGYALFDELPTAHSLGSAALIIAGCLLLLRR